MKICALGRFQSHVELFAEGVGKSEHDGYRNPIKNGTHYDSTDFINLVNEDQTHNRRENTKNVKGFQFLRGASRR